MKQLLLLGFLCALFSGASAQDVTREITRVTDDV